MTADEVIAQLGLAPLPHEGGHWTQVWIDDYFSSIYFLLRPDDFSAFHRAGGIEQYHHYAGAPAELWQLRPDGTSTLDVLGPDLATGQRPVVVVPDGVWQASRTLGDWSLLGCTMAPPYHESRFRLADRAALLASHPDRAELIGQLTRAGVEAP